MRVMILGCGTIGELVGTRLAQAGHAACGVRRNPDPQTVATFPIRAGDIAAPVTFADPGDADAVLIAANPGLRRGRDNGLATAATLAIARWPQARLVYTGTTSIYADAGGAGVDEQAALGDDPATRALLAIEQAVLAQPQALILRATALVGPTRRHALDRMRAGDWTVRGRLDRPFSWLHEFDLADLCVEALTGGLGRGVLNAASPDRCTVGDYYRGLAATAGLVGEPVGDGSPAPVRWIDAGRLWSQCPQKTFRHFLATC